MHNTAIVLYTKKKKKYVYFEVIHTESIKFVERFGVSALAKPVIPLVILCLLITTNANTLAKPVQLGDVSAAIELAEIPLQGMDVHILAHFRSTFTYPVTILCAIYVDNTALAMQNLTIQPFGIANLTATFYTANRTHFTATAIADLNNALSEQNEQNNIASIDIKTCDIYSALDVLDAKIQCLPDAYFKPPAEQRKHSLHNKIMACKQQIADGEYAQFIDRMRDDIKAKMDGFEGNPNDDWIINESAQRELCAFIKQILAGDYDGDALGFEEEVSIGTNPFDKDTDDDMLCDGQEVLLFHTNPLDDDSDDDGIWDGYEVHVTGSSPRMFDTDLDFLPDGLEIGLSAPQGNNTNLTLFVADSDPATTTSPIDDDTDDDGIIDGNEDVNHNGKTEENETAPFLADTDNDGLNDGLEMGLTAPQGNHTAATWQNDTDPSTTTNPLNPDCDNDGLVDGDEDANHNGRVDLYEPDPNNPDSDGDGILDGTNNEVVELYLNEIVLTNYNITTGKFYVIMNREIFKYSGYRVPESGYWEYSKANGTIVVNELLAVTYFMNTKLELYEENVSEPVVSVKFCKNQTENFTVEANNTMLYLSTVLREYAFSDPNATSPDADSDGINDTREIILASAFMKDFRMPISEGNPAMSVPDSDFDGLLDGEEVDVYGSNFRSADTDTDMLIDGYEARTTQSILFSGYVPEPPVPYIENYTPPLYNIQDLNSTSAYVRDVEIYGDLRTGYIEISLWHENLSDVEIWMRPVNLSYQIIWKVWQGSGGNGSVQLKLDMFWNDPNVEDMASQISPDYFTYWKDWEIMVYDMEKGYQGRLESVAMEFGVSTKVTQGDTDNDGLSDGYESKEFSILEFSLSFGVESTNRTPSFACTHRDYALNGKYSDLEGASSLKIYLRWVDLSSVLHSELVWAWSDYEGGGGIERGSYVSFRQDITEKVITAMWGGIKDNSVWLAVTGKNVKIIGGITTTTQLYLDIGNINVEYEGHNTWTYWVWCKPGIYSPPITTDVTIKMDHWIIAEKTFSVIFSSYFFPIGRIDVEAPLCKGGHIIEISVSNPNFFWVTQNQHFEFLPAIYKTQLHPNNPDIDKDGLKDGEEELPFPNAYAETGYPRNKLELTLSFPGFTTIQNRWIIAFHFGGENWEVPVKCYIDTLSNEWPIYERNSIYFTDAITHTLIFVPAEGTTFTGWAVGHPLATSPFKADTDDDYLTDYEECHAFIDNENYYWWRTNPQNPDSDGDGLSDGFECARFPTNPLASSEVVYTYKMEKILRWWQDSSSKKSVFLPPGIYKATLKCPIVFSLYPKLKMDWCMLSFAEYYFIWLPGPDGPYKWLLTMDSACNSQQKLNGQWEYIFILTDEKVKEIESIPQPDTSFEYRKSFVWVFRDDSVLNALGIQLDMLSLTLEKIPLDPVKPAFISDKDSDGLSDEKELKIGSDPSNPDSDGDNYRIPGYSSDYSEYWFLHTSPILWDTDGDYISDSEDTAPLQPNYDVDGDGFSNMEEILVYGSDWKNTQNYVGYFVSEQLYYENVLVDGEEKMFGNILEQYLTTRSVNTKLIRVDASGYGTVMGKIGYLKGIIKNEYNSGMLGAVLVGYVLDQVVPVMKEEDGNLYPTMWYFEDLDGLWLDTNNDQIFEKNEVSGKTDPEIWVSALMPPCRETMNNDITNITIWTADCLANDYFKRVQQYENEVAQTGYRKTIFSNYPSAEHIGKPLSGEAISILEHFEMEYEEYDFSEKQQSYLEVLDCENPPWKNDVNFICITSHGTSTEHTSFSIHLAVCEINGQARRGALYYGGRPYLQDLYGALFIAESCHNADFVSQSSGNSFLFGETIAQFIVFPYFLNNANIPIHATMVYPMLGVFSAPVDKGDSSWIPFFYYYDRHFTCGSYFYRHIYLDAGTFSGNYGGYISTDTTRRHILFGDGTIRVGV